MEAFKIGFFCEHASGFHIHEDLAHVRILGSDGATAAPGEAGEIVVSNLVNRASILLNYPIGDVAALSEGGCPCGRTFRLLSELEGRAEDVLPLIDGRFVHPRAIWQVFKQDREVLQYQLTQHDPERFELRLVTADEPAFARARNRALPSLRALLGPGATIEASRGSELDRPANEKFRAVVSRCAPTDFA